MFLYELRGSNDETSGGHFPGLVHHRMLRLRPRPRQARWRVFIVTEGAQNVRLGLVEVRILSIEETKSSIAKTKAQADREIARLQPQLKNAMQAFATAEIKEKAREAETQATERAYRAALDGDGGNLEETEEASHAALHRLEVAFATMEAARKTSVALDKSVRSWKSGEVYFGGLPPPTASFKTDADGKFSIPLDRNAKVVLAASATRRLLSKTENYYWLVTVSLDDQPSKRMFLSNDNLATSDAQDSLVHVVE